MSRGLTPILAQLWLERELEYYPGGFESMVNKLMPLLARVWEDGHADFEDIPNPYGKATDYALEDDRT